MTYPAQSRFLRHAVRDGLSLNKVSSRWEKLHLDPWLLSFIGLNALLGLAVVYSASGENTGMLIRQAISFGIGFVVLFF